MHSFAAGVTYRTSDATAFGGGHQRLLTLAKGLLHQGVVVVPHGNAPVSGVWLGNGARGRDEGRRRSSARVLARQQPASATPRGRRAPMPASVISCNMGHLLS